MSALPMVTPLPRPVQGAEAWAEVIREFGRRIPAARVAGDLKHRRILFLTMIGGSDLFAIREGLMAHALRMRGAEVIFVLCDGFPVCEARTFDNDPEEMCESCFPKGADNLRAFGHDVIGLGSLVPTEVALDLWQRAMEWPAERLFEAHHAGLPLGRHVHASTLRYFRAGTFDADDPAYVERARRDLAAAMVMAEAARRAYRELRPDKLFSNHPFYASWGPWCDMARANGIPWDIYHGGWRRNTIMAHHDSQRTFHCDDLWPRYRERELTAAQESTLDGYQETRETNRADFNPFWEEVDRDTAALRDRLDLPDRDWRRVFCAFSNVSWDAADFEKRGSFDSMFDWIRELIGHFADRPDALLLIKSHPAERKFVESTPQHWRIADRTKQLLGELPDNVRFIPPEDNASTFALYHWIDAGLVNTSTVGLEMALAGLPVLMTGVPVHYARPGIVRMPEDRADYFRILDRAIEHGPDFAPDRDVARRYAYTIWFRKALPFDLLDVQIWNPRSIAVHDLEDLRPGRFPGLDALCDGVLHDAPFEFRE